MKKVTLIFLFVSVFFVFKTQAQIYRSSSGEMIFSFADANYTDDSTKEVTHVKNIMRFTVWFHLQQYWNYDFNNNFGVMFGVSMRNIGFISEPESFYFHGDKVIYSDNTQTSQLSKVKQRTYTLGVPVAFKLGNLEKGHYFFAGAEYEYAFHYKEKVWIDNDKKKYSEWWGDEVTQFLPSVFAGVTFSKGATIKFKWYLENFINQNHSAKMVNIANTGGDLIKIKPYENYNVQLFYVSLAWTISSKDKKKKTKDEPKPDVENEVQM